jgi:AcrR family transcriptional regulator
LTDKRTEIFKCGKELFSAKGFKDTNVAEIMQKASMATGTFYNYFSSKDKLFMEIYNEENIKLKKRIMDSLDLEGEPGEVMQQMMLLNFQGMSENPILREWYNKDVFNKIEQAFREDKGIEQVDFLYESFIEVVKKWQAEGKIRRDISPELIMAMFGALINVDTHKEEVGLKYFPQVLQYLAEFTMKGLTDSTDKG